MMRIEDWPATPAGETLLFARLRRLCDEGSVIADRIRASRGDGWHSFVPADNHAVLRALLRIRPRRGRFLELGSAIGVITIMADLLGLEAHGIEIAPELVARARELAARHGSGARFATGSYVPEGYRFVSSTGDTRTGALGIGEPAYAELGYELDRFDWIYAYPWPGEGELIRDLVRRRGGRRTRLLLHAYTGGVELYRRPWIKPDCASTSG